MHGPHRKPDDSALLAAGLPDGAVARQLGVSQRTVERRVQNLMAALNARTRFQAGVQVGHRQGLHAGTAPAPTGW